MGMSGIIEFFTVCNGKRLAVVAHQRPDGDAVGSVWGLCHILQAQGIDAHPVNISPVPGKLRFLVDSTLDRIHENDDWFGSYDALVVLDCGEWMRLDPGNAAAEGKLPTANIDHHATSAGVGETAWIEPEASSTGEMIVRLAKAAGWTVPANAAQALWTAIAADTGRFSFENTGVPALEAATECVRCGANPARTAAHIYQSLSRGEFALQYRVMGRMEFFLGGRMAISWLSREDFRQAGIGVEGVQDLVNILRTVEGVEAAVFFYETPSRKDMKNDVKVNVRTSAPHDATALAKHFGGGGHLRAAGCTVNLPIEEARKNIIELAEGLWFT